MTQLLHQAFERASLLPEAEQDQIARQVIAKLEDQGHLQRASIQHFPSRPRPVFGSGRGTVTMSDDFDAPLDDFKEYME